jgi:hypothetical protein
MGPQMVKGNYEKTSLIQLGSRLFLASGSLIRTENSLFWDLGN